MTLAAVGSVTGAANQTSRVVGPVPIALSAMARRAAGFSSQEKLTLNELLSLLKAALEEQLAREEKA